MVKNIDWGSLGFGYIKTDFRYVSNFKDGKWDDGILTEDSNIVLNESAGVLQYAQTCFEGLKAYRTKDGHVVCFRPDLNAKRMKDTCERLEMPVFPEERFLDAVEKVVKANIDYVPPYGSGATLYLRPYMFGSNPVIGVKPADEYQFRIFTTPVGPYFKGGAKAITVRVPDFDRAAPKGTGHIKAGLNYAMSLHPIVDAHKKGFAENIYLDPATRTKVEETGGANIIFITKDNKVVTPKSNTILPSITRRSLMYVAKHYLGLEAEEREIYFTEVKDFKECALCGTAAVLSPVGYLSGLNTVRECCEDEQIGKFVRKVMYDELLPTLNLPKEELEKFAADVLDRFVNPYVKHFVTSIMLNSFPKFKTRDLPGLKTYLERKGELPKGIVLGLAGIWIGILSDYRSLETWKDGEHKKDSSTLRMDKGHAGSWNAFLDAAHGGKPAPITPDEIFSGMLACFGAIESIRQQDLISIPPLSTLDELLSGEKKE